MTRRPFPLHLYSGATGLLEPLAPTVLRQRAKRGKEDLGRLSERMGHPARARPDGALAWLHGASVGEGLSLLPLVEGLRARRPALNLLVTSGTATSARLLAQRLPEGVLHQYAPVDLPQVAGRFIRHWKPSLAVFVESEIWPNLIGELQGVGAKLALVSARLSAASLRNWSRAPESAQSLLGAYDLVLAQDDRTAEGLARLGARDDGRLNLKLAGDPLPVEAAILAAHRRAAGDRPVLLAASTHSGDEAAVLQAYAALVAHRPAPHLVIVPRHPERGGAVAELSRAAGFSTTRQSVGEPFSGEQVHVADLLGELGLWFRLAVGCFLGGSWANLDARGGAGRSAGGHNPLEPARLGCPVAPGPEVANWRPVFDAMGAAAAVRVVADADALAGFWAEAMAGAPDMRLQAERASAFAATQTGALDLALDRLEALL